MFKGVINSVKVRIALESGVYSFPDQSATGKTRLYSLLKKGRMLGYPVTAYTYQDLVDGVELSSILDRSKCDIVLLDRYDLYAGERKESICDFIKHGGIILLDCKESAMLGITPKRCSIKMTADLLEVFK